MKQIADEIAEREARRTRADQAKAGAIIRPRVERHQPRRCTSIDALLGR